ncbi:MAG: hypothetical protein ACXVJD_18370 [Mucilaginibacter sp.]
MIDTFRLPVHAGLSAPDRGSPPLFDRWFHLAWNKQVKKLD